MGCVENSEKRSFEISARRDCLEKAKQILWAEDIVVSSQEISPAYIDSLVDLHDSLHVTLSESSPESIYSQFHLLRWPGHRDESKIVDKETIRQICGLEADLYRAMWLNSLILLSATNISNPEQHNRKRQRRDVNTSAGGDDRRISLQRTIDKCRVLVRLLEQAALGPESIEYNDHGESSIWDEHIRNWTKDDMDEEEDNGDSLNILTFTKEQLEAEEQQLLNMAGTPIPTTDRHSQQQHRNEHTTLNKSTSSTLIETNKSLMGRLVVSAAETFSSESTIPVEMDHQGILRATDRTTRDDDAANDGNEDNMDDFWWSLTSQSIVNCGSNESLNNIQISNVISIRTAEITNITLDVGKDSMLWLEQVASIQSNAKRYGNEKLAEGQVDIVQLWSNDEVIAARKKARELFAREIRAEN